MSSYYVLKCMAGLGPLQFKMEVECTNKECWKMGRLFLAADKDPDFHPPETVIEIVARIDSKASERIYPELSWNPLPLMSRRLVAAFQSAGVTNLQTYETRLANIPEGNPTPEDYYLAVNVIGLVAAADLAKSETDSELPERMISMDFHSLAVDPMKARDALMFRLAENISAVLVHERIKKFVESKGITTLTWYEPEGWAG
jgi:uncharacterized protein DUF1629